MGQIAAYFRVFLTFARNSLVRDMTFRGNFIIDSISSLAWVIPNVILYLQVFRFTNSIGKDTGWEQYQFYVFFATGLVMNSVVQMFFMTNVDELTDLGLHVSVAAAAAAKTASSLPWALLIAFLSGKYLLMYGLGSDEAAEAKNKKSAAGGHRPKVGRQSAVGRKKVAESSCFLRLCAFVPLCLIYCGDSWRYHTSSRQAPSGV